RYLGPGSFPGHHPSLPRPARRHRLCAGCRFPGPCFWSCRMSAVSSDRISLIRHANADAWTESVAREMETVLAHEIEQRGRARMLLSGGTTPAPVYEALAAAPLE